MLIVKVGAGALTNKQMSTILVTFVRKLQAVVEQLLLPQASDFSEWKWYNERRVVRLAQHSPHYIAQAVHFVSRMHAPLSTHRLLLQWFSCGSYNLTYKAKICNGLEVWKAEDSAPTSAEINAALREFCEAIPVIMARLFGPAVWRKGSIEDIPQLYGRSFERSIFYKVFHDYVRCARGKQKLYLAHLPSDRPRIHELVTLYGIFMVEYFMPKHTFHVAYVYDSRIGLLLDNDTPTELIQLLLDTTDDDSDNQRPTKRARANDRRN